MQKNSADQDQAIWIYMTAANMHQAKSIASALLQAKLIACANFAEQWTSMYWWEGQIQEDRETIIIAKSTQSQFSQIEAVVIRESSYECPCVIALPIVAGHQPYLQWLRQQTQASSSH